MTNPEITISYLKTPLLKSVLLSFDWTVFHHNPYYLQSEQYVKLPFRIGSFFASINKIPFFEGNLLEIPCKICQEILPSSVHFRRHCIDKHKKYNYSTENNESYCCEECGKTFKKTHLLTIHKRTAHVDKTQKNFKCDLCDYTSYAKRYILDHKAKVHDEYKHVCDQCGERFR